jgi:hypothetical protein
MLNLGPMERGTAVVKLDFTDCEEIEELVWVRGCYDHYIRWTVSESRFGGDTCHELDVEDCPEYIHHWYDHFYCERPCPGSGQREHVAAG